MKKIFSRQIFLNLKDHFPKTPKSLSTPGKIWRTRRLPSLTVRLRPCWVKSPRVGGSVSLPKNTFAAAHLPDSSRPEGISSSSAPAVAGELVVQRLCFLCSLRTVICAGRYHGPATREQQCKCNHPCFHSSLSHFFVAVRGENSQRTTNSSGCRVSRSHPDSVTTLVCPKHIACPESLSIKIMWRKNTMFGSAITGLPW